ncbi:MAG: helix-turn-helix transcriptional regulator [Elusimicrobiota bacterium]|jgi:transcriptional regulator with XRE-family HTH domain
MQDIYCKVGVLVRARREHLGLTQEELGEAAGMHPSFIGQIERGVKRSSLQTLARLAGALGVGLGDLIEDPKPSRDKGWESKIGALLRDKSAHDKEILYSTLRHLSRELKGDK